MIMEINDFAQAFGFFGQFQPLPVGSFPELSLFGQPIFDI
jgi:hypothetical protein